AKSDEQIVKWVVGQLKSGNLRYAIEDIDAPENWPRTWVIWRGNAMQSSAKGAEFFLRHYLGTHDNAVAEEHAKGRVKDVVLRDPAPRGKMDLVCDINFRMETTALYSDMVLPTAMWYEKNDLNTTDLHSFIHPLGAAVPPVWEAKTDYEIFKAIAKKVSELAPSVFPQPVKDIISNPLIHDTPDELAQDYLSEMKVLDWGKGEIDLIPGKTGPHLKIVERDYVNLYNRWIS
ncbi:molybdopterin-dependent oxidoreductase, partial [Nitrolancea hollandica]